MNINKLPDLTKSRFDFEEIMSSLNTDQQAEYYGIIKDKLAGLTTTEDDFKKIMSSLGKLQNLEKAYLMDLDDPLKYIKNSKLKHYEKARLFTITGLLKSIEKTGDKDKEKKGQELLEKIYNPENNDSLIEPLENAKKIMSKHRTKPLQFISAFKHTKALEAGMDFYNAAEKKLEEKGQSDTKL